MHEHHRFFPNLCSSCNGLHRPAVQWNKLQRCRQYASLELFFRFVVFVMLTALILITSNTKCTRLDKVQLQGCWDFGLLLVRV